MLASQRDWRTPIGRFVVTGQYFTAGSIVVLAIGMLIGIGLFHSRSKQHGIPTLAQPEVG
ncbi:hypothetical protein [Sphingomonas sp. Leaf22]|uniref:hypothetical protein n=1 Tax=Sphingomonas sp. Leaf22 TaxID=1735687 RepID=UPI000AAACC56|nr:hypothetical protein [Sphingomonas sp. Leaf22]